MTSLSAVTPPGLRYLLRLAILYPDLRALEIEIARSWRTADALLLCLPRVFPDLEISRYPLFDFLIIILLACCWLRYGNFHIIFDCDVSSCDVSRNGKFFRGETVSHAHLI